MTTIEPVNNFSKSGFIPEIYAKKLAREVKKYTQFIERNCNREWEGNL